MQRLCAGLPAVLAVWLLWTNGSLQAMKTCLVHSSRMYYFRLHRLPSVKACEPLEIGQGYESNTLSELPDGSSLLP